MLFLWWFRTFTFAWPLLNSLLWFGIGFTDGLGWDRPGGFWKPGVGECPLLTPVALAHWFALVANVVAAAVAVWGWSRLDRATN